MTTKITSSQPFAFDSKHFVEVDLDRTPGRAAAWDHVQIDDRGIDQHRQPLTGSTTWTQLAGYHVTSIGGYAGPEGVDDLSRGCFIGAVYLEDGYFQAVRDRIDVVAGNPWPCDGRKAYQLTTVAYARTAANGARSGKRYAGYHGRVITRLDGARRAIELSDIFGGRIGTYELDLAAPSECDEAAAVAPGEAALTVDSGAGHEGAIFIELAKLSALSLENPKLPIGLGG